MIHEMILKNSLRGRTLQTESQLGTPSRKRFCGASRRSSVVENYVGFRSLVPNQADRVLTVGPVMVALTAFGDNTVVASSQSPPEQPSVILVHFKLSHMNPLAQI